MSKFPLSMLLCKVPPESVSLHCSTGETATLERLDSRFKDFKLIKDKFTSLSLTFSQVV